MNHSRVGHIVLNIHSENMLFYKEFFKFLEWEVLRDQPNKFGVGDDQKTGLWFTSPAKTVKNDYDGPGTNHIAIIVDTQEYVAKVHKYLQIHNIQTLFDTPRHRPEFCHIPDQTYYQIMFESPDNILFEVYYKGSIAD